MRAVTLLQEPVKVEGGRVYIDRQLVPCVRFDIGASLGGAAATVWLQRDAASDGSTRAVFQEPGRAPRAFLLSSNCVAMLTRMSSHTVATWMRRAASTF